MTINLINPNFNLIDTARITGMERGAVSQAKEVDMTFGGSPNFSDILQTVISDMKQSGQAADRSNSYIIQSGQADDITKQSVGTIDLDDIFQKAAETYHVPVELLKAVAKAESGFNPRAESHAGAQGIMQLMPATAKSLGVSDSFDPEQNIMGGAKYLSSQLDRFDGNTVLALAAYNAGPGNVAKYNGVPPFKETQNYIAKVMGYAGETITAGQTALPVPHREISSDLLQQYGSGLTNLDSSDLGTGDYALLLELYRYQMQLNLLADPESSDSKPLLSFV